MQILYGFLTVLMFLDCVLLILLVLLQLPKKEAGAGLAFGSGATDALFGAGSGNVLTKITKWVAGIFFSLALLMAMVGSNKPKSGGALLEQEVTKHSTSSAPQETAPASSPTAPANSTGLIDLSNAPQKAPAPNK